MKVIVEILKLLYTLPSLVQTPLCRTFSGMQWALDLKYMITLVYNSHKREKSLQQIIYTSKFEKHLVVFKTSKQI